MRPRQRISVWLVAKDGNETGLLVAAYVIYRGVRSSDNRPDRQIVGTPY